MQDASFIDPYCITAYQHANDHKKRHPNSNTRMSFCMKILFVLKTLLAKHPIRFFFQHQHLPLDSGDFFVAESG